jgi:formiminoglutamate deiminase
MSLTSYHADHAWLGGTEPAGAVRIDVDGNTGRIATVTPDSPVGSAHRLRGLTIPGFANVHSHAFHRALRGRTQAGLGTFWTWRDRMYDVAARLDPDSYHRLARAVYAEMALAGVTHVGEFHYLHHSPDGTPYADPNAMGRALIAAAAEAGIRITLLDTLYLTSTVDGRQPEGVQRRFSDGTLDAWQQRVAAKPGNTGAAIHSVRAVPAELLNPFSTATDGQPLHVHLSEQRAENDDCHRRYGCSPTELLHANGVLGPLTTAVHATHLSDVDRTLLGDTGTSACFCPTTERDLADGIGPARALLDAGSLLCLGTDSHAVIDMFEEARAVELDERLRTERRGHFTVAELLTAATTAGHRALGDPEAGSIAPGARADLVTIDLDGVRTAGAEPLPAALFAATAADVTHVLVGGKPVVEDRAHVSVDVARELREAVAAL